ncbi:MAG: hypothetical protein ACRDG4_07715 [Chloroflexota bacterium]
MSTAPGAVAKAFLDALPTLDYNKLVGEARRQFGIVIIGEDEPARQLIALLRGSGAIPSDAKLELWRHRPGIPPPIPVGKTELAIILPVTEAHLAQAKETFPAVQPLPVVVEGSEAPGGLPRPLTVKVLDKDTLRTAIMPELIDRLWERRLPVGRALPATRERISGRMISMAARDMRVVLGSVAGAGSGRSGIPTAATAQLLLHQASLVVGLAAVYGESLDDKGQIFRRVAPKLAPTFFLDGAEAGLTRLADAAGKGHDKLGKLYGPMTAYVARPTLSAGSTLLAGVVARRIFRGSAQPGTLGRVVSRTRSMGRHAAAEAGQGVVLVAGAVTGRFRRPGDAAEPADGGAPARPRMALEEESRTDGASDA